MNRKHVIVALIVFVGGFLAGSLPIKKWVVSAVRAEETDKETLNKYKQIIIEDTKKREKERETLDKEWHEELQDIGRFQFHGKMPFILDTKKGHVWHFSKEATAPRYMGQALPWND